MSKKVVQALLFFVLVSSLEAVSADEGTSCAARAHECNKSKLSPSCQAFKDQKLIDICRERYNHHQHTGKACTETEAECKKLLGASNNNPMCNNFYHVCTDCCGFNQDCLSRCRDHRETCFHNPPVVNPSECWIKAENYGK